MVEPSSKQHIFGMKSRALKRHQAQDSRKARRDLNLLFMRHSL